ADGVEIRPSSSMWFGNPMQKSVLLALTLLSATWLASACDSNSSRRDALVGAWRSQIHFSDGAFAEVHDLEFTYVFNAGGTMTESSNYDGAPPVPPAYGTWRQVGSRQFEAKYAFFRPGHPRTSRRLRAAAAGCRPAMGN